GSSRGFRRGRRASTPARARSRNAGGTRSFRRPPPPPSAPRSRDTRGGWGALRRGGAGWACGTGVFWESEPPWSNPREILSRRLVIPRSKATRNLRPYREKIPRGACSERSTRLETTSGFLAALGMTAWGEGLGMISRVERAGRDDREPVRVHALREGGVRLFPGDRPDEGRVLVEIGDAEAVVDGGVDRMRDPAVRREVYLEASYVRALLVGELLRRHPFPAEANDLLERRGDRRVAALRLDREADGERPGEV